MKPRVLVTRVIPDEGLDPVREACEVDLWTDELPPPRDELLRRVAGMDGLLSLLTDTVDDELLDAAGPQLKVVSNFAVGFDNIDVAACTRRGIPAGNTPGVLTETTADLAFALLMAAARRIPEGSTTSATGRWKTWGPMLLMGVDIHGATLGIVGFGRIGREMARRGRGFGMRILYHDVHPATPEEEAELGARRVEMDELLRESDFISLHVNLTDETHHLIDADALRAMKPTAVLVNTSRGPVVDPDALERRAPRRRDLRRGPRRDRARAAAGRPPAGGAAELRGRAAHRVGIARDARQDGRDGRREPAGRAARRAAADADQPRGLRVAVPDSPTQAAGPLASRTSTSTSGRGARRTCRSGSRRRPSASGPPDLIALPLRRGRAWRVDPRDPGDPVRHRLPVRGAF